MNQILAVEKPQGKRKHKSGIHSILTVFAVILMIFGLGLTSSGGYEFYKSLSNNVYNNIVSSSSSKPVITIERESASTINIVVTHDKAIANVTYTINDEEPVQIDGNNKTEIKQEVELPVGSSTINITAKDINGISSSYESKTEVEEKPTITLEQVEGKIKATVTSKINIDHIMYYWDENESDAKQFTVNDIKTETLIDVLEGTHTLNVVAVDANGNKTTKQQKVIGDNKPELEIKTNGKVFRIISSDDEGLAKIEYSLNSGEVQTEEINQKEYQKDLELSDGKNTLTVTVYNSNGLISTTTVEYVKE